MSIAYAVSGTGGPWLLHTTNMQSATLQFDSPWSPGVVPTRWSSTSGLSSTIRAAPVSPSATWKTFHSKRSSCDLEAVADAAGIDKAVVFGFIAGTYVAVWYAAAHPERVSHLALWLPPEVRWDTPPVRAGAQLAISDWETFTEYFAHQALGWDRGEQSNAYARAMRETVSRETWLRFMGQWSNEWGSRQDEMYEPASRVQAPTPVHAAGGLQVLCPLCGPDRWRHHPDVSRQGHRPYFGGGLDIVQAIVDSPVSTLLSIAEDIEGGWSVLQGSRSPAPPSSSSSTSRARRS